MDGCGWMGSLFSFLSLSLVLRAGYGKGMRVSRILLPSNDIHNNLNEKLRPFPFLKNQQQYTHTDRTVSDTLFFFLVPIQASDRLRHRLAVLAPALPAVDYSEPRAVSVLEVRRLLCFKEKTPFVRSFSTDKLLLFSLPCFARNL